MHQAMLQQQQEASSPCDWKHLPSVAVQAISQHCCPATKARLRLVCSAWHQALATQFSALYLGPGNPAGELASTDRTSQQQQQQQQQQHLLAWVLGDSLHSALPAVSALQLVASSSREYEDTFTQDLAALLASQRRLTHLTLHEVHELEELDTLDPTSLWDVLAAALPVLSARLQVLRVAGCFWNQPELFEGLRQLTAVTELRLANTPLETAYELHVVASMTQLVQLELGVIFDGSSTQHDVPRALASLGGLHRLQALAIPIWRRSLGGRAHPLAPALSAALQQLTGLTNLAVDGKFSQLGVVSGLTNLRQLASAAPVSMEGWQAICKLSNLTLLTSLTPHLDPLQLNPDRPHPGCDLAHLTPKASLAGMDVAVLFPGHLATLAQFTALQKLNLRCASTFHQPQAQAQLLTAMACLPAGLTCLSFGPLLPLSPQLFSSIGRSCPGLLCLHASFTHTSLPAARSSPGKQSAAAGGLGGTGRDDFGMVGQQPQQDQQQQQGMELDSDADPLSDPAYCRSSVSQALGTLQQLQELELMLLSDTDRSESPTLAAAAAARRSSSYGGAVNSPPHVAAAPAAAAAGPGPRSAAAVAGWLAGEAMAGSSSSSRPVGGPVQLQLEQLPKSLKQLRLAGNCRLCYQGAPLAAADSSRVQGQQQQQQTTTGSVCQVCQRKKAAAATAAAVAAAGGSSAGVQAAAEGTPSDVSSAAALCDCMQGLQLAGSGSSSRQPPQPPKQQQRQQQQQQQQRQPDWPSTARRMSPSSSGSASPTRLPALSGLKRPASYPTIHPAQLGNSGSSSPAAASAAAAAGGSSHTSAVDAVGLTPELVGSGAAAGHSSPLPQLSQQQEEQQQQQQQQQAGGVFLFEQQQAIQKRSRSFSSIPTAAATGAGDSRERLSSEQQQQQPLPQLAELCLFRVQVSYQALSALVQAAGPSLSKLQLLQLCVIGSNSSDGLPPTGSRTRSPLQQQQQQQQQGGSYLTTQQLLDLQVSWGSLQELHIHPYQLWGMLSDGCMSTGGQPPPAAVAAGQQPLQPPDGAAAAAAAAAGQHSSLQHVTQLLSLRHLYVVNVPVSFEEATPPNPTTPPGLTARIPTVGLPPAPALSELLAALQAGLQQLPALRQLLLYMGPAAPAPTLSEGEGTQDQQEAGFEAISPAAAASSAGDQGWGSVLLDAAESLLQALPSVRVRQFRPSMPAHGSRHAVQAVSLPQQQQPEQQPGGDGAGAAAAAATEGAAAAATEGTAATAATAVGWYDSMEPEYMI